MTEEAPKKKAPRRRVVVPKPLGVETKELAPAEPAPPAPLPIVMEDHPFIFVECFGCQKTVPQRRRSHGGVTLPAKWSTLFLSDRKSREESPDVYAEEDCVKKAAYRLAQKRRLPVSKVTVIQHSDFIPVKLVLDP